MNGWKIATFVLGGLVVAQFFWWNKRAPEVLNLGNGSSPRLPRAGSADQTQFGGADPRFGNNWLTN